ncbi:hypothetical protein [Sporosarcina sp. FSL K6-5500]|uniref:hypothetical protein n=1 Tax=Sporosarcina sp. FSL K6-5500 TaxID=2921558 RepID=UPI0030FC4AEF
MQIVLAFLLFFVGFVSLITFFTLWLIRKVYEKEHLRKVFGLLTLSSVGVMVLSFVIIINAPSPEKVTKSITERGSQVTGLKTSEQKFLKNNKEIEDLAEKAEETAVIKEEKDRLAAEEKAEAESLPKEQLVKVALVKEDDSVLGKSNDVIYNVFQSGDDEINETISDIEFDESEKVLMVTVKGKDGLSEKSIGLGFYEDSTAVYRELAKDDRIDEVWLTITFPMRDTYGNVANEDVMGTYMSRKTMDKINWQSFDYQKLLDVVDGKRIYPQFVQ